MQGILKGASKMMENLALKRLPLYIFAAQTAGQVRLNQYYSSSWKYLLYESLVLGRVWALLLRGSAGSEAILKENS